MGSRTSERGAPAPVPNRCRCGHFPTAHLEVRAVSGGGSASFALLPVGSCRFCGPAGCPAYAVGA
ncbi:MAG TPA: hypothetical protein VGU43_00430 [Thermoplasmata archaeon]|nr:hypothetical protein [Thermoplasmata archaeon]